MVNNPAANAGDVGSIPGVGRSLGGGQGNPLQYSCLEMVLPPPAWGSGTLIPSAQRLVWAAKQPVQEQEYLALSNCISIQVRTVFNHPLDS